MLAIDFETYYDRNVSLKKMSPEAYLKTLFDLNHPPYLVSLCRPGQSFCGPLGEVDWESFQPVKFLLAHNARFDQAVLQACVKRGLIPESWLELPWVCTADLSVYFHAPRNLKDAAKYLLGVEVSKDLRTRMNGKLLSKLSDSDKADLREYCMRDAEICYKLAEKYLPQWPDIEQEISRVNRKLGMYGCQIDEPFVEDGIRKLHTIKFEAEKKLPWRDNPDADTAVLSPKAVVKLCQEAGVPVPARIDKDGKSKTTFAQNEPEVIAWEEEYGKKYPWVAAMRDYRKANILLKKLQTMQRHSVDGILYFALKYFGAHTGRFAGEGGMNMQNLPGRKESFVSLRHAVTARPGRELCVIDWCQIEPRILRWTVKDQEALDLLARGISIYEAYAIQHFGWVSKGVLLKKENPPLYGLVKAAVLGAGYGCGGRKYKGVAKAMADIDLTEEEAAHQVDLFRQQNPRIVSLWNTLAFHAKLCASRGKDYLIKLPSGRKLHYYQPRLASGLTAHTSLDAKKVSFLHGGLLTENYVQAVARDVFTEGLVRLDREGYCNLFHVHDEYVLEVPLAPGQKTSDRKGWDEKIRKVLLAPIPWLPNCPLDVEFKWRFRYG